MSIPYFSLLSDKLTVITISTIFNCGPGEEEMADKGVFHSALSCRQSKTDDGAAGFEGRSDHQFKVLEAILLMMSLHSPELECHFDSVTEYTVKY